MPSKGNQIVSKPLTANLEHQSTPPQIHSVEEKDSKITKVYIYVVDRDFGFAPNPFHGVCTLACCKYRIRATAKVGDWVFGMGGSRLKATGRCVYGMKVTQTMSFDEYWINPRFLAKRPIRNGSRVMMIGDNIYSRMNENTPWHQEDSHHSFPDGSPNQSNVEKDTRTNIVLVSEHFAYFGKNAIEVPNHILGDIGYRNGQNHRVFTGEEARPLLDWFSTSTREIMNTVLDDPFDFRMSGARYSSESNKIIKDEVIETG